MLNTIQAGRGIAALAVVMFHLSIAMGDPRYGGDPVFSALTWRGNLGVDFFFVLSGFIMMYIHENDVGQPHRWRSFARARFTRLFPIYWLYTAGFCALVALGFGTVTELPKASLDWLSVVFLVRLSDTTAPLAVAWTLFHEIAFYAIFSLLIINRKVGIIIMALWMVGVMLMFSYPPSHNPTPLQTYFAAYNIDFLIGIGSCLIMRRASPRHCGFALLLGMTILIATIAYEYGVTPFTWSGLLYGFAFGGIIAGMTSWEAHRGKANISLIARLGDASYTTYLIHVPIIGVLLKITNIFSIAAAAPGEIVYFSVLAGVLTITFSAHLMVEKPLQRLLQKRKPPRFYAGATA